MENQIEHGGGFSAKLSDPTLTTNDQKSQEPEASNDDKGSAKK